MNQGDPPQFTVPAFLSQAFSDLRKYLIATRPVAGTNVTINDAPSGGQQINAGLDAPELLITNRNGTLYDTEFQSRPVKPHSDD